MNKITESIITKLQNIPLDQQQKILEYIDSIAEQDLSMPKDPQSVPKKRILGLHQGKIWMGEDFNDPLPDDFWDFES